MIDLKPINDVLQMKKLLFLNQERMVNNSRNDWS